MFLIRKQNLAMIAHITGNFAQIEHLNTTEQHCHVTLVYDKFFPLVSRNSGS